MIEGRREWTDEQALYEFGCTVAEGGFRTSTLDETRVRRMEIKVGRALLTLRAELAAARAEVEKAWAASDAASRTLIRTTAALRDARAEITRRDELAAGHPGMCCGKCAREISDARAEVEAMRPVVEAAVAFRDPDRDPDEEPLMLNLWTAIDAYLATLKEQP